MKKLVVGLVFGLLSHVAMADTGFVEAVPTAWRLENYSPGGLVSLWYTGSTCSNGQLVLPTGSTVQESSRLFALISAAKMSNNKVFVYYNNAAAGCPIISFGLKEM